MEVQNHHIFLRNFDDIVSHKTIDPLLIISMLVCAVLCAVKAIENIDQAIFAKMIVSLASTYGIFIVSSILALDPW